MTAIATICLVFSCVFGAMLLSFLREGRVYHRA